MTFSFFAIGHSNILTDMTHFTDVSSGHSNDDDDDDDDDNEDDYFSISYRNPPERLKTGRNSHVQCRNCTVSHARCPKEPTCCHCYLCPHTRKVNGSHILYNKTVCYSMNSSLTEILTNIPKNITALEIVVDNTWDGFYPLQPKGIDLVLLSDFVDLQYFKLTMGHNKYMQTYPLHYLNVFTNLTNLREVSINLPLSDKNLTSVVRPLSKLEILNLNFTRGLSMNTVKKVLKALNNVSIRSLQLKTFQLIGGIGYNGNLDMINFFGNKIFRNLRELILASNSLVMLRPGISRVAPNLEFLDLVGNILLASENIPALLEAFLHPSITYLDMGYQGYIGGGLEKLQAYNGDWERQEHDWNVWDTLTRKTDASQSSGILNLGKDVVHCINENTNYNLSNILNKRVLLETVQSLLPRQFRTLSTFSEEFLHLLPNVSDMLNMDCMLFFQIPIGRKLQEIYFNHIHWEKSETLGVRLQGDLCFMTNNSLRKVVFTSNVGWIDSSKLADILNSAQSISGLENLHYLDVSHNNMTFNMRNLTTYFPNLKVLDIAGNNIGIPSDFEICRHMPHLMKINFANNHLHYASFKENCHELKQLNLGNNNLNNTTNLILQGTRQLRYLDLSYNKLYYLDLSLQRQLTAISKISKIQVNLTGNNLLCGCVKKYLQFYKWISDQKHNITFVGGDQVMCASEDDYINIQMFQKDPKKADNMYDKCFPSSVPIILGASIGTFSFVLLTLMSYNLHKHRWKLWYQWYCVKTRMATWISKKEDRIAEIKWKYDAFVSYCADDRFWVHDVLMKTLEEYYGFHLCIHYRDFPVGEPIPFTISQSMGQSREIIILISEIALKSEWCRFELDHAILLANKRKTNLIVIKMGKFRNPVDHSSAAYILDRYTYLEWPEHKNGHKLFWAKLVAKMYGDSDGCRCCLQYGATAIKYNEIMDENTPLL